MSVACARHTSPRNGHGGTFESELAAQAYRPMGAELHEFTCAVAAPNLVGEGALRSERHIEMTVEIKVGKRDAAEASDDRPPS